MNTKRQNELFDGKGGGADRRDFGKNDVHEKFAYSCFEFAFNRGAGICGSYENGEWFGLMAENTRRK